jgi:ABC-type transport system involved in multi-copper enzyme maturation permease subunit
MVAMLTLRECLRRRVFLVVPIATLGFLALYGLGNHYAFESVGGRVNVGRGLVDAQVLAGATLVGLSMFVTLFLASALAIFLTFSTIRGDAEQGLLQPVVVRPVARSGLLIGRFVGTSIVSAVYALFLYTAAVSITWIIGDWHPAPLVLPGLAVVLGVEVVIALSLLGSSIANALPNGIGMFMVYGAGLLAGLLAQLGQGLSSPSLETTGRVASWALPFEALYQAGLYNLTASTTGVTRVIVQLGPLGGAASGGWALVAWSIGYIALVGALAIAVFARRDL